MRKKKEEPFIKDEALMARFREKKRRRGMRPWMVMQPRPPRSRHVLGRRKPIRDEPSAEFENAVRAIEDFCG